jgi:hypothetical protein
LLREPGAFGIGAGGFETGDFVAQPCGIGLEFARGLILNKGANAEHRQHGSRKCAFHGSVLLRSLRTGNVLPSETAGIKRP